MFSGNDKTRILYEETANAETKPAVSQQRGHCKGPANCSLVTLTHGNIHGGQGARSRGGDPLTTEPILPPSNFRKKAKNYTCFIVSSFQEIL